MEGQVAMVTGGAMGIGKAFVDFLLSRKVKVTIADINEKEVNSTIAELRNKYENAQMIFQNCDVSQEEQIEDAIKKTIEYFGKIDILINNAGIANESKYREMMAINMNGAILGTMLGLKYLGKNSGGSGGNIINMSSAAAIFKVPIFPVYTATKSAILGFTRSVGEVSLPIYGVRINCICPSQVDTQLSRDGLTKPEYHFGTKKDLEAAVQDVTPDMQTLKPEDVTRCLATILDDTTLTGTALFCSTEHANEKLQLPDSLNEACAAYIPSKK